MPRPLQGLSSWGRDRLSSAEERALAGRVGGLLWLTGAVTLLLTLPIPGSHVDSPTFVVVVAAFALAWALAFLVAVPWERAPTALLHVSTVLGLGVVVALTPVTGGAESPVDECLWFIVVFSAFFYSPRQALVYWAGAAVARGLPLIYDGTATQANLGRELVVTIPIYVLVGAVVVAGRELLTRLTRQASALEREQRRLAEEQSSLRRVATAVAAGSPPSGIFALVSSEAGRLLGADEAAIARYQDGDVLVLGQWSHDERGRPDPTDLGELAGDALLRRLRDAQTMVGEPLAGEPGHARLAAPVHAGAAVWGALVVTARTPHVFAPGAQERLQDYADLVATALANADDRARLEVEAATDALTRLPNHRAFRERLESEVARARRHGRSLTVALVDVDGFREINDRAGLDAGDDVLADIAALLAGAAREEDLVARMGADKFGLLFVECGREQALAMADRARALVAETPLRLGLQATVSIGLCDLRAAASDDELLRRADAALSWAKEHGRDLCWLYDPAVVRGLDERVRTRELDRSQALVGLRALARAIDAKDPTTREHAERVAALAARLATVRGWPRERVALLRDAALLHDVGKIGTPDAILLKPGPLDDIERAIVREHPVLGAQMVADVLDDEQIAWVAAHHEQPDGLGYPAGLDVDELPEGAALLALAEAWDAMVSERPYSEAMEVEEALDEVRFAAGLQFTVEAVAALETLADRGALTRAGARVHQPTA